MATTPVVVSVNGPVEPDDELRGEKVVELVNSAINNAVGNAVLLTTDGDGPWDGAYDGEWWWWVLRPLTFILTFLVIAFIVRVVIFGGFRRFNGPGGPGGGGYNRDRDRDGGGPDEVPLSRPATHVETPRVETPGLQRARDILAERYARGEIDGEEYRGRLDQLG